MMSYSAVVTCGRRIASRMSLCRSALHACLGEAWHARCGGAPSQVEPPRERQADRVEREADHQRELRAASQRNRLAEAARDQIAAAGADGPDEAERGAALDAGVFQGLCTAGLAAATCLAQVLLAEDRRDHPVGRTVADAGGDEQNQEHHQEAGEVL